MFYAVDDHVLCTTMAMMEREFSDTNFENLANVSTECFSLHQVERRWMHSVKKFSHIKVISRTLSFSFYAGAN